MTFTLSPRYLSAEHTHNLALIRWTQNWPCYLTFVCSLYMHVWAPSSSLVAGRFTGCHKKPKQWIVISRCHGLDLVSRSLWCVCVCMCGGTCQAKYWMELVSRECVLFLVSWDIYKRLLVWLRSWYSDCLLSENVYKFYSHVFILSSTSRPTKIVVFLGL